MIDITDSLTTARQSLAQGRRGDWPTLRAMLTRDALDPHVSADQRGQARAMAQALDAAIRGGADRAL